MSHFYISAMLFALCVALGLLIATFKGQWSKKFAVIGCLALASALSYRAFNDFYGFPAVLNADLKETLIVGHLPVKKDNVIYVWAIEKGSTYPKSFVMPYNKKTADMLAELSDAAGGKPFKANLTAKFKKGGHLNPYNSINNEEVIESTDVEGFNFLGPKED